MYLNPVIVTLAICSSVFVNAQSIERSVISSFGMHYTGAALQTDCTIGEVITFTGETENGFLTQGFHQPVSIVAICQTPHEETIDASACSNYELNGETYTTAGSYTQMLIAEDGCDSIIYLNLTLNALSNAVIADDNTLSAVQDNATYAWTACGEQLVLSTSQIFSPMESGDYQVTITQENCEVVSECISFVVGVGEFANKLQFNLYPNPTRDILNLEIAGVLGSSSLSVYDAMGALVRTEQINGATSIFSVTDLSVGTYMLVLRTNEIVVSKPFVKL